MQGVAGLTAHHVYENYLSRGGPSSGDGGTPLTKISSNATSELSNRLAEGFGMHQQDLEAIKSGAYKLPWDMTTLTHRQYNPLYILSK